MDSGKTLSEFFAIETWKNQLALQDAEMEIMKNLKYLETVRRQ